jgi:hypothetical protein
VSHAIRLSLTATDESMQPSQLDLQLAWAFRDHPVVWDRLARQGVQLADVERAWNRHLHLRSAWQTLLTLEEHAEFHGVQPRQEAAGGVVRLRWPLTLWPEYELAGFFAPQSGVIEEGLRFREPPRRHVRAGRSPSIRRRRCCGSASTPRSSSTPRSVPATRTSATGGRPSRTSISSWRTAGACSASRSTVSSWSHGARRAALGRRRRRVDGDGAATPLVGILEAGGVTNDPSGDGEAGDQDAIASG